MKRRTTFFFLTGLLAITASFQSPPLPAAEPTVVKVWPGKAPGVSDELQEKEFTEGGKKMVAGNPIYLTTDISSPELVLYRANSNSNAPAVVICPGGQRHYLH